MPQPLKEEDLKTITKKVYALYAKYGSDGISMDEVARQASISKATLYRYFTSKEDIVRSMVEFLISHLDSLQLGPIKGIGDVTDGLRKIYMKSIFVAALTGTSFLADLKNKHSDLYRSCCAALTAMQERSAKFFEQSVQSGFLRDLSFPLVSKQYRNMLPLIINMDFLEQNRMTLPEAIREYYRLFLYQILRAEYLPFAETDAAYSFVPGLAGELQNDFYIDSIRR